MRRNRVLYPTFSFTSPIFLFSVIRTISKRYLPDDWIHSSISTENGTIINPASQWSIKQPEKSLLEYISEQEIESDILNIADIQVLPQGLTDLKEWHGIDPAIEYFTELNTGVYVFVVVLCLIASLVSGVYQKVEEEEQGLIETDSENGENNSNSMNEHIENNTDTEATVLQVEFESSEKIHDEQEKEMNEIKMNCKEEEERSDCKTINDEDYLLKESIIDNQIKNLDEIMHYNKKCDISEEELNVPIRELNIGENSNSSIFSPTETSTNIYTSINERNIENLVHEDKSQINLENMKDEYDSTNKEAKIVSNSELSNVENSQDLPISSDTTEIDEDESIKKNLETSNSIIDHTAETNAENGIKNSHTQDLKAMEVNNQGIILENNQVSTVQDNMIVSDKANSPKSLSPSISMHSGSPSIASSLKINERRSSSYSINPIQLQVTPTVLSNPSKVINDDTVYSQPFTYDTFSPQKLTSYKKSRKV
ncbi:hypothetical protein TBLA_0A10600 [Henningerozyma blattae CBS 6284]|uniref:Uncharacterized protein n=1 Tax=Henningerozyma blattae (strain ATCC 34711 / CBS 6284 / DSM 70876 / NBRC 10599 / NRRL Y-10934 / UCD 77-7) TaxID=1071380 RepID=I2GXI6_HENB6|nr:hypothetical protein TBLA_0A10600 [Tetrapisispora blattae CBS 6284]CCH58838.1 hypothetical protein TBLA_0A10600 [Tetrapisispora blattae CBS 6284]